MASTISLEKRFSEKAPELVNLAKTFAVTLEKKSLTKTVARVALVLDATGSMRAQYRDGKVQKIIDRIIPIAVQFDDDGELDVWTFAQKAKKFPSITLDNVKDYIAREGGGYKNWLPALGGTNNEPVVTQEVIEYFKDSKLPVYIVFISDGGVAGKTAMKKLLTDAAKFPIFWQFVGIGGKNYGILEQLDDLSGRIVDNCNFFSLDDIEAIDAPELYDRLFDEFPQWLTEAKDKGIA